MKFLFTGAGSILAVALADSLVAHGHQVRLIGRSSDPAFTLENPQTSLKDLLNQNDFLVHFAHSFKKQIYPDINESSARHIIRMCDESKIKKCVYISSDSASKISKSHYGQSKYRTEQVFLTSKKSIVLRVGVISDQNIPSPFTQLIEFTRKTGFLIFPQIHKQRFTTISVEELAKNLIYACINDFAGGPYSACSTPILKSVSEILFENGVKPRVSISLPVSAVTSLGYIGRTVGIFRREFDSASSLITPPDESPSLGI